MPDKPHGEVVFQARIMCRAAGKVTWFFVTLPAHADEEVKFFAPERKGLGTVKVAAQVGATEWRTSLFPDKQTGFFALVIKAAVRHAEGLAEGDEVTVSLQLVDP